MKQVRQGDVLLVRMDESEMSEEYTEVEPDGRGRLILAEGEATGHAHAVPAIAAALYVAQAAMLLRVREATRLEHEEHAWIDLDPGLYRVVRQREYHPTELRRVAD